MTFALAWNRGFAAIGKEKRAVETPGPEPEEFGVELLPLVPGDFARNDVGFVDPTGVDHDTLGVGLKKAIYNYTHGIGLDADVRTWFPMKVPRTTVARQRIAR